MHPEITEILKEIMNEEKESQKRPKYVKTIEELLKLEENDVGRTTMTGFDSQHSNDNKITRGDIIVQ